MTGQRLAPMVLPPEGAAVRRQAPTLRVGSHNLRGFWSSSRARLAAQLWRSLRLDVVLLQETKLNVFTLSAITHELAGWRAYWAHGPGACRGVAILVRAALCAPAGPLTIDEASVVRGDECAGSSASASLAAGSLIHLRASWGGHALHIASIYLPNSPTQQRSFIQSILHPLLASLPPHTVALWGGDFNFVPDAVVDRTSTAASITGSHPDYGVQRWWREHLSELRDAFRHRHPTTRSYTRFGGTSASRLDRLYVSEGLLPFLVYTSAHPGARSGGAAGGFLSDHRPVTATIAARCPLAVGGQQPQRRPLPRVRLGFAKTPALMSELALWVEGELEHEPAEATALLSWWASLKGRLARRCLALNTRSRQLHRAALAAIDQPVAELYAQADAGDNSALAGILAARHAAARDAAARAADFPAPSKLDSLHPRELPQPYISRRVQPPRDAHAIPGLRLPGGSVVTAPAACARRAAQYWAGISAQPAVQPAAQQEVLQALAGSPTLATDAAAALGDPTITEGEVEAALARTPRGKAPGADGVPAELYCKLPQLHSVLARVFTAAGMLGALPQGFHEGVISQLYKQAGDRLDPASYRPITLLNTDYRLLAKVLARRLSPHLQAIISPEQTAFIPGRSLGENIQLLQLLPHLLHSRRLSAYAVFCDFRKAYDTVDRSFLLQVMDRLGVGAGFLHWVRLLLTGTSSRALVNGHLSGPAAFQAGVRQGCPLAPLLYLFIGQALLCFLKARGIGLQLPGGGPRLVGAQYADDLEVLLASLAELPAFQAAMEIFAAAAGQRLNPSKTVVLPIGASPPAPPPPTAHGFTIGETATALGITFAAGTAPPSADWPARLAGVQRRYSQLADLRLSAFGRGFCSGAYGLSTLLYHAEFVGLPPPAVLEEVDRWTAKLVDRGQKPTDSARAFAGVPGRLLAGSPKEGGLGALPWVAHLLARHVAWARRLICGDSSTPWIWVARQLVASVAGYDHPLTLVAWARGTAPSAAARLPAPLQQMLVGLQALRSPTRLPLTPGLWCREAPLFGNPYLTLPDGVSCLDTVYGDLVHTPIQTVGKLLEAAHRVDSCSAREYVAGVRRELFGGVGLAAEAYGDHERARQRLHGLAALVPATWQLAAQQLAAGPGDLEEEPLQRLLAGAAWQPCGSGHPVPLPSLTVKAATSLSTLLQPAEEERLARFTAFAALAGAPTPNNAALAVKAMLARLWRGPMLNRHKEVFWRLVLNALPVAARMPGSAPLPCACGLAAAPDRLHHFWSCPVATAVVDIVRSRLPPSLPPLRPTHIWLARPPEGSGVLADVWDVVCVAAVAAMDLGRRMATRGQLSSAEASVVVSPGAAEDLAARAAAAAGTWFWAALQDMCSAGAVPQAWRDLPATACPFFVRRPSDDSWAVPPFSAAA